MNDITSEKLDRNHEVYQEILRIMEHAHTKPSPETINAIKELNNQMENVAAILERISIILTNK